jgi:hypothetical protein
LAVQIAQVQGLDVVAANLVTEQRCVSIEIILAHEPTQPLAFIQGCVRAKAITQFELEPSLSVLAIKSHAHPTRPFLTIGVYK